MLLFYAIFDSLGSKPYDPELFGKALPCLTAIGSSISPDYALTIAAGAEAVKAKTKEVHGIWIPRPVSDSKIGSLCLLLQKRILNILCYELLHFYTRIYSNLRSLE
jgi:hypothetical protein